MHPSTFHIPHSAFRTGFTLIEMLVSIAILLAIMGMVGVIFNTASKSSSLAQSTSAVYRNLLTAAGQIRRDLERCMPGSDGQSHHILAIAGVEVLALGNEKDAESNRAPIDPSSPPPGTANPFADVHRADVLMFTTDQDIQTYVFRQPAPPNTIELDRTAMVTYGHADTTEIWLDPSDSQWKFRGAPGAWPKRIESTAKPLIGTAPNQYRQSDLPSHAWHLTRRVLRFPAKTLTAQQLANLPNGVGPPAASRSLASVELLQGQYDVYFDPYNDPADARSILPRMGRGYYHYADPIMQFLAYHSSTQLGTWWYRLDSGGVYLFDRDSWFVKGGTIACSAGFASWKRSVAGQPDDETCAPPENFVPRMIGGTLQGMDLNSFDVREAFYNPNPPDRRTILDPTPPAGAGERMGAYFLPNCSDFLVEYTYDDPAELLLVPDASGNEWRAEPQAPIRWQRVPSGQQMVWSRLSVNPKNYSDPTDPRNRTDPIRWPRALRITLRGYGPGSAPEEPVEHVIVHTFE